MRCGGHNDDSLQAVQQGPVSLLWSDTDFYSLLNLGSSEMFRCGTARRPARGRMCGNTAQFAELISPSEGIRQTTTFSDLGIIIYIALQTGIPRNAVSLLRSCESLWTGVETVAFGETPLRPVPDVVRYHLMLG